MIFFALAGFLFFRDFNIISNSKEGNAIEPWLQEEEELPNLNLKCMSSCDYRHPGTLRFP